MAFSRQVIMVYNVPMHYWNMMGIRKVKKRSHTYRSNGSYVICYNMTKTVPRVLLEWDVKVNVKCTD